MQDQITSGDDAERQNDGLENDRQAASGMHVYHVKEYYGGSGGSMNRGPRAPGGPE